MNKHELEADVEFFEKCKELCEIQDFNIAEVKISKQICERAIRALLKQFPAKPHIHYECPGCSNYFDYFEVRREKPSYCKKCGQRLDWEE